MEYVPCTDNDSFTFEDPDGTWFFPLRMTLFSRAMNACLGKAYHYHWAL
jgi:hypothetical protein